MNTTTPGASTPSFSDTTDFVTGSGTFNVFMGDVNGDGKPDIVTSNPNDNTVSVLLNTTNPGAATPSFASKIDFATSKNPSFVAIGDLNGDGKPDLAVANKGDSTMSVLFNSISLPLPVELNSFNVSVNGNSVNLTWQTATEVNNHGFEIQRAPVISNEVRNLSWDKIGFVEGSGNSNSPKDYSFIDQPTGGTSFSYRLKQIDNDGKFKYYDPITVTLSTKQTAELMDNYPHPFNPSTAIKFYIPNNSDVSIKIYDILGKEVTTLINKQTDAGYHIVYWNGRNSFGNEAASGMYLYRLTAGPSSGSGQVFSETKKMLLMK